MLLSTRAIVISSLKYGDTSLIVKLFTASDGLKSYLLKGAMTGRKGRLRAAYFQPLTQLEVVATHRNKGSLEQLREVRLSYPYESLHLQPLKSAMVLFLAEVLGSSIREEEQNRPLYDFMEASLQWLDAHERIADFHLLFLVELSKYLGFYPHMAGKELPVFDLVEGAFTQHSSQNPGISGKNLEAFKRLLGTNFDALETINLSKKARLELLNTLLLYFEVHIQGFRTPRSLAVLHEVFN